MILNRVPLPQPVCRCGHGQSAHVRLGGACEGVHVVGQAAPGARQLDVVVCGCRQMQVSS